MKLKILAVIGILALLAVALVAGGWFVNYAYAQGPTPGSNSNLPFGGCHNNQAVLDLLKTNAQDLLKERQGGKSLLDIAAAKGVSEKDLTDALLDPMDDMHAWMQQNYPQSNAGQMTQFMRDWIARDIRQSQYGTMTDYRLFGGPGGMMGGLNGFGGMMNGRNGGNGFGGMMGGRGGMMGGRAD